MGRLTLLFLALISLGVLLPPDAAARSGCSTGYIQRGEECVPITSVTDIEIRQYLIQQSLASYSGSCPCPYNLDRSGRQCGRRSAYSRPGGRSPLCYAKDITDEEVRMFRNKTQ